MRLLLLLCLAGAGASCTTLENRRDLYRSPAEGYEQWFPHPPPTRRPAGPPLPAAPTGGVPQQRNGVISFPEESLPQGQ
ncbi:MAG: hypothetical protein ABIO94_08480 [Opitutaceae bacterium]